MAFDYSGLQATATRLIARFGRPATLIKMTPGAGYDPGEPAETPHAVTIVAADYKQMERDGTLVQQNDRRYYLAAGVEPESQDVIADGGERLTIVNAGVIKPGPAVVLYVLQVRHA